MGGLVGAFFGADLGGGGFFSLHPRLVFFLFVNLVVLPYDLAFRGNCRLDRSSSHALRKYHP